MTASWLDEPWGRTSHGTRRQLLVALTAMLVATAIFDGLLSEAFEAQINPLFVTPLFLGSCAMFAACAMSTWFVMIFEGCIDFKYSQLGSTYLKSIFPAATCKQN